MLCFPSAKKKKKKKKFGYCLSKATDLLYLNNKLFYHSVILWLPPGGCCVNVMCVLTICHLLTCYHISQDTWVLFIFIIAVTNYMQVQLFWWNESQASSSQSLKIIIKSTLKHYFTL